MDKISLTVFFEGPFWVGLFEREADGLYQATRQVFGAEPSDAEVYAWLMDHPCSMPYSPPIPLTERRPQHIANPKRMQRMVRRELSRPVRSTKAQAALQAFLEAQKGERTAFSRKEKEAFKKRKYALKVLKKKKRHKGH